MSAVITAEDETTTNPAPITWTRTAKQGQMVADHLDKMHKDYSAAPVDLYVALTDTEIIGTAEISQILEFTRPTRVFQFYTERRDLAAAYQTPHPSAMPDPDASGGHRGAREITGVMKGRFVHWTLQSGRCTWDALKRAIELQSDLNHGGAPRAV